ncbi:transposase [Paenibacillus sp. GCM10023250]|uniref:transposase n=1 Tax=Paenibacillus sp. GCM10023250 TaxID=3252648 RepID=UPI003607C281
MRNGQHYDEESDSWTCAEGRKLLFRYASKEKSESGFEMEKRHYRCEGCTDCPLKAKCTKAAGDREISVSLRYMAQKKAIRERLSSEEVSLEIGWLSIAHNLLKMAAVDSKRPKMLQN